MKISMQDFTITATTASEKTYFNLRLDVNFESVNHEM